jgi:hypothetical protein
MKNRMIGNKSNRNFMGVDYNRLEPLRRLFEGARSILQAID